MNSGTRSHPSPRQRVKELLVQAIGMYSDRLTDPTGDEYLDVLEICSERAEAAFAWHRQRWESDALVFEQLAPRPIAGTRYTTTHPLQDLVLCELVMRGHSPAVSLFADRIRGVAEKTMRKIDPTHRSGRSPGSRGPADSQQDFSRSDAAIEATIQALLHDSREEYRKGTKSRPDGQHAGELDGLPLRGLPLRSFRAQTPLFNWICRILPRLLRKLQVLRSISSTEELGTGTIAAGASKLLLHTGYFHETRHIRAFVRISGAGRDGRPLGTRLLDVHSRSSAITQKPAETTVSVPGSVRLVHRTRRELQPADAFDSEGSSGNSDPAITDRCTAVLQKLMHSALIQSELTASEIELLRNVFVKPQAQLAKERGVHTANIGRQRDRIIEKLSKQFRFIQESAGDEETLACLELVYANSKCPTFAELLMRVLESWPLLPPLPTTQPSLHATWELVMRNVPEESQPSQSGAGVELCMHEILRNSTDQQGSIGSED
ncbi:MAG: hypothetical protein ACKO2P_02450 [Planctomycetota bacterium]